MCINGLNSLLCAQKDLDRHAAKMCLKILTDKFSCPQTGYGGIDIPVISYPGWHQAMQLTSCQWQTVNCCQGQWCLKRKKVELDRRPAINNQWPQQVNGVFGVDGDASVSENHWANQTLWWLLSHQIAVKHTTDKAISWRLSQWTSSGGIVWCKFLPDVLNGLCWSQEGQLTGKSHWRPTMLVMFLYFICCLDKADI